METETKQEILEKRKEIEGEILEMLEETESKFQLQDVKNAIFDEEEQDDFMHVVAMFDRGGDASELSNALEIVTDAWNYFPHKALGGLSPAEQNLESVKK
jgi:1,4-alpha-glucan branching enzyme